MWLEKLPRIAQHLHPSTFSMARFKVTLAKNDVLTSSLSLDFLVQFLSNRLKCIDKLTGGPFLE